MTNNFPQTKESTTASYVAHRLGKSPGFTLLEMIVAMALSSVILLLFLQWPQRVIKLSRNVAQRAEQEFKIWRVLRQIERDLTGVCWPILIAKNPDDKLDNRPADSSKTESKPQEKPVLPIFKLESAEEKSASAHFKEAGITLRLPILNKLEFMSTTSLEEFGRANQRLVRLVYELVREKTSSSDGKDRYNLYRTERTKLVDRGKRDEPVEEQKIMLLSNLTECFFESVYTDTTKTKDGEFVSLFQYSEDKNPQQLPHHLLVRLAVLSQDGKNSTPYELFIPVMSNVERSDVPADRPTPRSPEIQKKESKKPRKADVKNKR